jgi:uncharacterized membrane protein YfcA
MLAAATAFGLVIGLVIGGLGGGGGVLTVPALVYLLGLTPQDATTSSVIIVGISAALGVAVRIRGRGLDWRTGIAIGVVGTPAAYAGSLLNHRVDRPTLLLAFAAVTILAAAAMLSAKDTDDTDRPDDTDGRDVDVAADRAARGGPPGRPTTTAVAVRPQSGRRRRLVTTGTIVVCGVAVGFLTGFLGVGGGFVVLPVLVVVLRMPMTRAIGTSLLIILINSSVALVSRSGAVTLDWHVLVPFTLASVVGTSLGHRVAERLSGATLTRIFAVLLLIVGVLVGVDALRTLAMT